LLYSQRDLTIIRPEMTGARGAWNQARPTPGKRREARFKKWLAPGTIGEVRVRYRITKTAGMTFGSEYGIARGTTLEEACGIDRAIWINIQGGNQWLIPGTKSTW
jgi:hypothetical protein